ncbi:MAG: hypothetical protein CMO74_14125 [Verrucomicrobiales bacterium]|nr:hypothetical protein [Verrucomicrobiales bacterium]|tara:strand:+ start:40300 stop:40623 length:324 start_codon:yes stop_codon:yes gene_type:complete
MKDTDKNKVTLALANSFLQQATLQQTLQIVQEKALERAKEEVEGMEDAQIEEVLTNIRAQEIAQELRESGGGPGEEEATSETSEETTDETSEETTDETSEETTTTTA